MSVMVSEHMPYEQTKTAGKLERKRKSRKNGAAETAPSISLPRPTAVPVTSVPAVIAVTSVPTVIAVTSIPTVIAVTSIPTVIAVAPIPTIPVVARIAVASAVIFPR